MTTLTELYHTHTWIVDLMVRQRLRRPLPYGVEVDDLKQTCHAALWEAANSYDPARGSKFSSWCSLIISRRIIDWACQQDHLSRRHRKSRGRKPKLFQLRLCRRVEYHGTNKPIDESSLIPGRFDGFDQVDSTDSALDLLRGLTSRTRKILWLYFVEEKTQAEISKVVGIVESRVYQIVTETVPWLRERARRWGMVVTATGRIKRKPGGRARVVR